MVICDIFMLVVFSCIQFSMGLLILVKYSEFSLALIFILLEIGGLVQM